MKPYREPRGTFWREVRPTRCWGVYMIQSWRGGDPNLVAWATWADSDRGVWYPLQRVLRADLAEFRTATSTQLPAVYMTPILPGIDGRVDMHIAREILVALDQHLESGGFVPLGRYTRGVVPMSVAAENQRLRNRARKRPVV